MVFILSRDLIIDRWEFTAVLQVLPGEAGSKAPAGLGTECPPELLAPSPTLHCICKSQQKTHTHTHTGI